MNADELTVCTYLKGFPGAFVSGKEVCRRADGKRRAAENPRWAIPVLQGLVEQRIVESDATGHFRLIQKESPKAGKKWVSPQVLSLLKASGKNFAGVFEIQEQLPDVQSCVPANLRHLRKRCKDPGQPQSWPGAQAKPTDADDDLADQSRPGDG